MNNITMIGRVTAQPELKKTTNSGKSVCTFDIAVKRPFTQDITDFFTCIIWERKAEILCNYVKKGQQIGIQGYGYNRKWQDKNGNNRISFEINVNDFYFCDNKSNNINNENDNLKELAKRIEDLNIGKNNSDDFVETDDDLPF